MIKNYMSSPNISKKQAKKVAKRLIPYLKKLKNDWGFVLVDPETGRKAVAPTLSQAIGKAKKRNPKGKFIALERRAWKKLSTAKDD